MPEKNHKETLESTRQKLSEIIDQSESLDEQKKSFMSPEQMKEELDNELELLQQEVAGLEGKRQELIYKADLTDEEREELQLLNEIARDIYSLQKMIRDFKEDLKLTKEEIIATKNPAAIIKSKEKYAITNIEIFEAIKVSLADQRDLESIPALEKLRFSDAEIKELSGSISNTFILLRYCQTTPKQKKILYEGLKEKKLLGTYYWGMFLSKIPLPTSLQNQLIEELFIGVDYRAFGEDVPTSSFAIEVLESPFLTKNQKKRTTKGLLKNSRTHLDIKHILTNYGQYLDEKTIVEEEKKLKEMEQEKGLAVGLTLPTLAEATPEDFQRKKIQFIVHPLYDIFDEGIGLTKTGLPSEELEKFKEKKGMDYLEALLVAEIQHAIKEYQKGKKIPLSYLGAVKYFEEYKKLRTLAAEKDTAIILILPDDREQVVTTGLLQQIFGQTPNIYYALTEDSGNGDLLERDIRKIDKLLPEDAEVNISGGYLQKCLTGTISHLQQISKKRRITLDYSDSTESWGYMYVWEDLEKESNLPELIFPGNPEDIKTLADVERVIAANPEMNEFYEKKVMAAHYQEGQEDGPKSPDFYIRHEL